jgi:hypothetical protein
MLSVVSDRDRCDREMYLYCCCCCCCYLPIGDRSSRPCITGLSPSSLPTHRPLLLFFSFFFFFLFLSLHFTPPLFSFFLSLFLLAELQGC